MKLIEFSVTNYRSITAAHKIELDSLTVLVGKNNEGKSNILNALSVAMNSIIQHGYLRSADSPQRRINNRYNWDRDFPIQYQSRRSGVESIFKLKFKLENDELTKFHKETNTTGNEIIPIEVRFGKENRARISVPKKGSPSYNKQSIKVTQFIADRISFNYIQAVRTEQMAVNALTDAIWSSLNELHKNTEYKKALHQVQSLQQKEMDKLSTQLVEPLQVFLPQLKSVSIKQLYGALSYRGYRSDIEILIDDGVETSISNKGDGIKSLLTLAILNYRKSITGASIVAIEEPESHLHPGAIHSLVEVIRNMALNNQVIVTTHNPLFVQQNNLSGNIIVNNGTARPAKSIAEVRSILGVMPSDNLKNARFILLVEGEDDKISLNKILSHFSPEIKSALTNNRLVLKPMGGVGNLSHDINDLKTSLCKYVILLDNDKAGRAAYDKAKKAGIISDSEIKFTICNGSPDAEFEDCINPKLYSKQIEEAYSVNISVKDFKTNQKWSQRMKQVFSNQGSMWNDKIKEEVKMLIANSIPETISNIDDVLIAQKSGFIKGLVSAVENMLKYE